MWQQVQTGTGGLNAYYQVVKGLTSGTTHTFQVRTATDVIKGAPATVIATPVSQPSCTIDELGDRRLLWQGQLTAGVLAVSNDGDIETGYGTGGTETGTLTPDAVTFRSTTYSVSIHTSDDHLTVSLRDQDNVWYPREEVVDALRLHVCNTPYDFSSAAVPGGFDEFSGYQWNVGFNWPAGIERTLRLSLPPNNVATGEPAISGTAQAGQALTADASLIMDTDGLTDVDFTYQWLRVDADGTSNEEDISGEIAETYTLTNDDVGKKVKVKVSFTDQLSGEEERTSAAYPSSGTVTAASTTAPVLTSVTVTSTPRKESDTYGAREHIEFSMTFDAPVTVTGAPTFAFDLGGASTATWYAGSGTTTLRFSHAVSGGSSGDEDTNGISWAQNAIALNGGTIAGTDNAVAAVLTHVAQSNLAGHKVDGRTTAVTAATVTVAVTSTPTSLADTYGFGETIVITVTASEAVEVVGDPEFEFSLTDMGGAANDVPATYDDTRSTATTIVFTYTVQAGDRDNNGIWIGDHSRTFMLDANDRIRTASQKIDIDRSHPEKSTHADHKVDGSLGAPTVPPDPTAPTLVSATATTLTIEWTHPGDGGSPLTRNFIEYRVEGTTDWTNWYRGETPTPVTRTVIRNLQAETAYDVRVHSTNAIGNSQWVQSATAFSTLAGTASCPVPTFTGRRKIWTGVLTMGDFAQSFPARSFRGYDSNAESGDGGGLDPVTFTLGSRDYEVGRIALGTSGASGLNFVAGQGQGEWWDSTVLALRLHVCNTNFDFSDSSYEYTDEDRIVIHSAHVWTTDLDWSGVTTRTVHMSLPLNRPATGAPVITGPATVGQVLAVDVTGIEDEDGLHDVEYTYQWVRVDADGTSNEEDITDETAATYTLTDDDLGKKVKIEVSFPDDFGSDEQRTSAPTETVTAVAMTTPGVTVSTTALTVTEEDTTGDSYTVVLDSQPTANITVTVAGHAGTDVTPSPTSLTFTTTTWGTAQTVTVTAGDDADTANDAVTLTHSAASTDTGYEGISIDGVAVTVTDNDTAPATGAPTITGTAQVGQTLTAVTTGIMDADGLTSPTYTYQWIRVDGTDDADIASANSSTYILVDADLGKTLKVRVTFADDLGHTETLTSAATATVGAVATGPPTVNDVAVTSTPASGTTYYLAGEVIEFTVTFSAPVTVTATPKFAFRLGAATRQAAYASGSGSAALVFARTVQAGEVDRNGISWNAIALALDGGTITQTGATTAASLTHAEQAPLEGHRVDAAPPMQVSASVQGLSLVLVYDEPLDPASMPATGAYTVTATVGATTTNPAVSEVSIYGIWVTLALDAAPAAGATVTLAYAPPASNPVQDEAGNDAPAFSGQSVRLGPPPPPPPPVTDLAQVMGVGVVPGNAQLVVTWTAVSTATGYTVQWMSGGQGYNIGDRQATVTTGSTTRYTIPSLTNGTEYTVRVIATRTGADDGPLLGRDDGDAESAAAATAAGDGPCAGDGGGGRPGQRAAGGDLDGGGQRHGLHGAVDVGRTGLQHRRPAGHGHDGVDHALHDSQPHQRHGIHGAGDRDPNGRRRRPAVGGGEGDALHHARRAAAPEWGAGRRAGDADLGCPVERRRVRDPPLRVCDRRQRDLDRRGPRSGGNGAGPDERPAVRVRGAGGEQRRPRCAGEDGGHAARHAECARVADGHWGRRRGRPGVDRARGRWRLACDGLRVPLRRRPGCAGRRHLAGRGHRAHGDGLGAGERDALHVRGAGAEPCGPRGDIGDDGPAASVAGGAVQLGGGGRRGARAWGAPEREARVSGPRLHRRDGQRVAWRDGNGRGARRRARPPPSGVRGWRSRGDSDGHGGLRRRASAGPGAERDARFRGTGGRRRKAAL